MSVFWRRGAIGDVEFCFTDAGMDLREPESVAALARAFDVDAVAQMRQVHGSEVAVANTSGEAPEADALVTAAGGPAVLVRVADCAPIVLAAPGEGLAAVVHAGRAGMVAGVAGRAVGALREAGASRVRAVLGPRACGRCYELPRQLADGVAAVVPSARSTTPWGTPAVDIGAGVTAQLTELGVEVDDPGRDACTIEDERFFSYRRQGDAAGRFGAVAVVRR